MTISSDLGVLNYVKSWEDVEKFAIHLASSKISPEVYRNDIGSCVQMIDIAMRIGTNPYFVMQNLTPIKGRMMTSGAFAIALINKFGGYDSIGWNFDYEKDDKGNILKNNHGQEKIKSATFWGTKDGKTEDATVTWATVVAEGWNRDTTKNGYTQYSKWNTMTKHMFKYRTAANFGRTACPQALYGMIVEGEDYDIEVNKNGEGAPTKEELEAKDLIINRKIIENRLSDCGITIEDIKNAYGSKFKEEWTALPDAWVKRLTKDENWNKFLKAVKHSPENNEEQNNEE